METWMVHTMFTSIPGRARWDVGTVGKDARRPGVAAHDEQEGVTS